MRTMVSNEIALKQFAAHDGRHVLSIVKSGDSFRFVEERQTYQPPHGGIDGYDYWEENQRSGLYETAAAAERDAELQVAWLNSKNTLA